MNWVVSVKGEPERYGYEIAIVREDDTHGLSSYGWHGPTKLIISGDSPSRCPLPKPIWEDLILLATRWASRMSADKIVDANQMMQ